MNGVVVILTDFGCGSNYVGVMKGVLLKTFSGCKIVDLFNNVKPQSVREGAWVLSTSCDYFPPSVTTHHQKKYLSAHSFSFLFLFLFFIVVT